MSSDFKTLADNTESELLALSRELRQQLFTLKLQKATARLEKPHNIRKLRRQIARVETKLSQIKS